MSGASTLERIGAASTVELRIVAPDFFSTSAIVDGHTWWRIIAASCQFSAGAVSGLRIQIQRPPEPAPTVTGSDLFRPGGMGPGEILALDRELWLPPLFRLLFTMSRPLAGAELLDATFVYEVYQETPAAERMAGHR